MSKGIIFSVVTATLLNGSVVFAANESVPTFDLDQMIVTATRYEKKDVDVPASTLVMTAKDLKKTGGVNLQQALSNVNGLISSTSRPGGGAINFASNSEIVIRGTGETLILVNGVPLNLNNRYDLNTIPTENVERVEIVKGGGGVLYGSEAVGGVINIITKKNRGNSVSTGIGNYGQRTDAVNLQLGKLGFGYNYEKWGNVNHTSDYNGKYNNTLSSENNNFSANYAFNDKWEMIYTHSTESLRNDYLGPDAKTKLDEIYNARKYDSKKDFAQLLYKDKTVSGSLYYNYGDIDYKNTTYRSSTGKENKVSTFANTLEKNRVFGADMQKRWTIKKDNVLLGGSFKNEKFIPDENATSYIDYSRNIYSLFAQYDKAFDEKNNFIVSARETWTGSAPKGRNYSNFSGQGQYVYKLGAEESLYVSVGQSFKMPTFKQTFGRADGKFEGNENVKPQKGVHYELGWKKNVGAHQYKAALFSYKIKDNISVVTKSSGGTVTSQYTYSNEDIKNTGVELSTVINKGEGMHYNYGLTFQNPTVQSIDVVSGVTTTGEWQRKYGRWQLNGGIGYSKDKWNADLNVTYLADRYMLSSTSASQTKPYLLTRLNINYAMDKRQELNLAIDNLLDRQDNLNHTGTYYYATPINFMLSYKYKF